MNHAYAFYNRDLGDRAKGTKDDDEIMTIQSGPVLSDEDTSETATIFDAFREVTLDLTFSFSTQNSPAASTTELQLSEFASPLLQPPVCLPSGSASAEATSTFHNLSRTTSSFAPQLAPVSPLMMTKKKFKSAKFSDQSSILRGSWPAIKYVGRGTPVDRSRRREWGGLSTENVAEDGLLFSDVRATSLDSRSPRISTSSEWDFLNPGLPTSGSSLSGGGSLSIHHPLEEDEGEDEEGDRIPPLQKIDIKLESETENWASAVETVLSSTEKGTEELISAAPTEEVVPDSEERKATEDTGAETKEQVPPEVIERLKSELQFDVNIDKALDLGFSPAVSGGTLFTLAAIADSGNSNLTIRRTTTASTQSQYSTPSEGPSDDRGTPILTPGSMTPAQESTKVFSDIRSTASTKAALRGGLKLSSKTEEGIPWWKKALGRLKRVQVLLRPHRNTC